MRDVRARTHLSIFQVIQYMHEVLARGIAATHQRCFPFVKLRMKYADFFSLHAFGYQWYVFNIADMAIVAGVVGLLYDSLIRGHKKVGNPSKM